ncbi:MAG: hypothetical protein K2O44_05620 [Clostridia bacterium]|nr:hypothetical protein [Clostridia bacterium]
MAKTRDYCLTITEDGRFANVTQKDVALYILDELGVSKPYVLDYESNNNVYLFDNGDVTLIQPGSELYARMKQIERDRNILIYAVTHDSLEIIGETYSFLCISPYPEDWNGMLRKCRFRSRSEYLVSADMVYAYVWNVKDDRCSESGFVVLHSHYGNITRVG